MAAQTERTSVGRNSVLPSFSITKGKTMFTEIPVWAALIIAIVSIAIAYLCKD
jgi:hypothetical protein